MSFSLSGVASGLDTNTIISQLMQIERIPYNKLASKKNDYNSQLSVFRNVNTKLSALRAAAEELRLRANFNLKSASNSDETVLRATASEGLQEGTFVIHVQQLATHSTFVSKSFDNDGDELAGTVSFSVNGTAIDVELDGETDEENLKRIVNAVNAADAGVRAALLQTAPGKKAIILTAKETGQANTIALSGADFLGTGSEVQMIEGKDAQLTINGIQISSSSNEIKDVVDGLSLTLLKENETATITIAKDADKVAEKVEAFVKAYNDVIDTIRSNTAQGKTLQGDFTLRTLQDTLFSEFNARVAKDLADPGNVDGLQFLSQIGLVIDAGKTTADAMTGQISFDKEKFKEALANDPDGVYRLFSNDEDGNPGIADRFSDTLRFWTRSGNGILAARIQGYDSEISFINKQLEDMERRLEMKEEQLKKQFTAMETMLIQLQNEQFWLNSQLAAFLM